MRVVTQVEVKKREVMNNEKEVGVNVWDILMRPGGNDQIVWSLESTFWTQ